MDNDSVICKYVLWLWFPLIWCKSQRNLYCPTMICNTKLMSLWNIDCRVKIINSRKNILTKLVVVSFPLNQAYSFEPPINGSINIHQSLQQIGRKSKTPCSLLARVKNIQHHSRHTHGTLIMSVDRKYRTFRG